MELVVKSHVLQAALDKASRTVGSSNQDNPLLESFNIHAESGEVRILSTDLEVGTIATVNLVDVKEPGAICVPAKKFIQVVSAVPSDELSLKVSGDHINITSGKANWSLRVMDAKGYPEVPKINLETAHQVDRKEFLSSITKVRSAVSQDPARTPLRMIAVANGRMMASDGQRLHIVSENATIKQLDGLQLPADAVGDLIQLMKRVEVDDIQVEQREHHILFKIGTDEFSTSRLAAEFPNVDGMILAKTESKDSDTVISIDKSELYLSLARVGVTAPDSLKAIKVVVSPDDQSLHFSSVDSEGNTSSDEVAASIMSTYSSDGSEPTERLIYVNIDNFMDLVQALPEGVVDLKLYPEGKTASPLRVDADGFIGVIMQLKYDKG